MAAAIAGKDELKLVAKRVREAKRGKPRDGENQQDEKASEANGDTGLVESLRERVAVLEAENKALRDQVAQLQLQLAAV